jgi:hypothetical protein
MSKTPLWYFCSGCGATARCHVCGATACAQNYDDNCPGCAATRKAQKGAVPWYVNHQWGRRPNKALRKTMSRVERHRRMFKRAVRPVKWKDLMEGDWG